MKTKSAAQLARWILSVGPWIILVPLLLGIYLQPQLLFQLLLPDQTVYSDGFKADSWLKVKGGMSKQQVIDLLGPPLTMREVGVKGDEYKVSRFAGNGVLLEESYYSNVHGPSDFSPEKINHTWLSYSEAGKWVDSYNVRAVRLNNKGIVEMVQSEYYQD